MVDLTVVGCTVVIEQVLLRRLPVPSAIEWSRRGFFCLMIRRMQLRWQRRHGAEPRNFTHGRLLGTEQVVSGTFPFVSKVPIQW